MRFFGHALRSSAAAIKLFSLALLTAIAMPVFGQTAPYVLPYTMSTFAGPHATYTVGAACGTNTALDTAGDGCVAALASIGVDPHDIRVDGQGNVYWIDNNASTALIHKISAVTGRMTVYVGSTVNTSGPCPTNATPQGDGCVANDGAANTTTKLFTAKTPKSRGLAIAANGDLYYADFNGNYVHKVSAATGILSVVTGTGTAGNIDSTPGKSTVSATRGVGVDANGNVYVADTGNGQLRAVYSGIGSLPGIANPVAGNTYSITPYNPATGANTKVVVTNQPASTTILNAVEDVQVDTNGNIFVADAGNNVVRAIWMGRGGLPGVPAAQLVVGNMYFIAGYNASASPASNTYPKDGTTPTFPANTVAITDRKIALDSRNNLYIADSSNNSVWFVDALTGSIRLLAGTDSATVPPAAIGCPANPAPGAGTVGDGCPGTLAALYSASDMGVAPDNQGNIYITDAQGGLAANARLRKLLSGLNFPTVNRGASITQTLLIHFGPNDTPSALTPFAIAGVGTPVVDYVIGTPTCTLQSDATTDCTVPVTFTPTRPGYDTATLTITSTLGGVNSYLLTGTGNAPAITIDPGSVSVFNSTVNNSQGVATDANGNIYIADTGNNRVLFYNAATGITSTFAGSATGVAGNAGDNGQASAALLRAPRAVAIDTSGNVFIADTGNNTIRRVNASGVITRYGGGGTACATAFNTLGDGCPATTATFNAPSGLAADNLGVLYVSDTGNNRIRLINTQGYVNTFAGGATPSTICPARPNGLTDITNPAYYGDIDTKGDGCSALFTIFNGPTGLAFDAGGNNLFVADTGNNIVRKIFLANTINPVTGSPAQIAQINPVTLVAGNGQAGQSIDVNATATLSQLSAPTGVAVGPNQAIYIADTGNNAVRLVTPSGTISTLIGVLGAAGTGTGVVPGTAANVQLAAPSAVSVSPNGLVQVADAGNNRILSDQRSQVAFQFGRTNVPSSSPQQTFIETNIGTSASILPTPFFTSTGNTNQFTLVPASGSAGCAPGSLSQNASCTLIGQFTPTTPGSYSATYTETGATSTGGNPSITLIGVGAVLTTTSSTVAQTTPATGNSQFGGSVTLTATVKPSSCNTAAPNCYPTGTVRFIVDGTTGSPVVLTGSVVNGNATASQPQTGLSVGPHSIACSYSGDNFYAASSCGTITITVAQASTTSLLSTSNNNQPQFSTAGCAPPNNSKVTTCTVTILNAAVISNTTGIPTGTVSFFANGTALGTGNIDPTTGIASLALTYVYDANRNTLSNITLPPGTYQLTCTYNGASNFATSNCAPISYTVTASPAAFSLVTAGCQAGLLIPSGYLTPGVGQTCPVANTLSGVPLVAVAQGSTTDATIFIVPSNTLSGTFTFSCSGLPKASTCTFSPTSVTLTPSTLFPTPIAVDMTLWTDLQPGPGVASVHTPAGNISFALLGWPVALLGLAGIVRFRRKSGFRGLALLGLLLSIFGSTLAVSGCGAGGPGAYQPVLTPAGTYPITVTVTGAGTSKTTLVYWTVTSPGITGQQ